jgi:hypothetical protein
MDALNRGPRVKANCHARLHLCSRATDEIIAYRAVNTYRHKGRFGDSAVLSVEIQYSAIHKPSYESHTWVDMQNTRGLSYNPCPDREESGR